MTVKDYMRPPSDGSISHPRVGENCNILQSLILWNEAKDHVLDVTDSEGRISGTLTSDGVAQALADIFTPSSGSSLVRVECKASDFSASLLGRAVEDADIALLGLWRMPSDDSGMANVLLMLDATDPSAACRSLRRFGFEAYQLQDTPDADMQTALEHISALKMFLEI